jgi:hypothetical protein
VISNGYGKGGSISNSHGATLSPAKQCADNHLAIERWRERSSLYLALIFFFAFRTLYYDILRFTKLLQNGTSRIRISPLWLKRHFEALSVTR